MRKISVRSSVAALSAALVTAACGDVVQPVPEQLSAAADAYLDAAIDMLATNSYKRHVTDWQAVRARAYERAGAAQTTADTHAALRVVLSEHDRHTFFFTPEERATPRTREYEDPTVSRVESGVGYVSVPAFAGSGDDSAELATLYHSSIGSVDEPAVCAWIVDLRGNGGGNMWPMLAGLSSILGPGVAGYFIDPDADTLTWEVGDGTAALDGATLAFAHTTHSLFTPEPAVAVLTDGGTASSGEGVTIAFRGRPHTRSFGQPTAGLSTGTAGFELADGALMIFPITTMADRAGLLYGEEVSPDEVVTGSRTGDPSTDAALRAAATWLARQPSCSGG